ncbi:hypothetical protein [Halomonas elongata]|uniref:hypothetical protein n=1 Tax=Halomonas elongata TaxID=2746 RepID=UPI00186BAB24|nr:hypothetical protein [Halomonas elongata]MBW5801162.1 hypothetical protein [Halomonas elongata]
MANVTQLHPVVRTELDLPMEVLGVLMRQAEPTVGEIAHDIEVHHQRRFDAANIENAIGWLQVFGYEIHEHDDPDGVRYELVTQGGAA